MDIDELRRLAGDIGLGGRVGADKAAEVAAPPLKKLYALAGQVLPLLLNAWTAQAGRSGAGPAEAPAPRPRPGLGRRLGVYTLLASVALLAGLAGRLAWNRRTRVPGGDTAA